MTKRVSVLALFLCLIGALLVWAVFEYTPLIEHTPRLVRIKQRLTHPLQKEEPVVVPGKIFYVAPQGSDDQNGSTPESAFKTIQKAIDLANPGDTIQLEDGIYMQHMVTRRNGKSNAPITITGTAQAIVKGGGGDRVIEIIHDHITLSNFTVDGLVGDPGEKKSYRDKLIFMLGKEKKSGVTGVKILGMTLRNAGGECIRLRYFAQDNEIANNSITGCGAFDFKLDGGGKNGEGIYIGTAPEQTDDGKSPTDDRDASNRNWIHDNTINTQGNECVDIKEGSSKNIVEYNTCTGQQDKESAGLDSRGSDNIFRYNTSFGNKGAGIRLGGDKKNDGINNVVQNNILKNNEGGGVKILRAPQKEICGNTFADNGEDDYAGAKAEEVETRDRCGS